MSVIRDAATCLSMSHAGFSLADQRWDLHGRLRSENLNHLTRDAGLPDPAGEANSETIDKSRQRGSSFNVRLELGWMQRMSEARGFLVGTNWWKFEGGDASEPGPCMLEEVERLNDSKSGPSIEALTWEILGGILWRTQLRLKQRTRNGLTTHAQASRTDSIIPLSARSVWPATSAFILHTGSRVCLRHSNVVRLVSLLGRRSERRPTYPQLLNLMFHLHKWLQTQQNQRTKAILSRVLRRFTVNDAGQQRSPPPRQTPEGS